MKGEQVKELFSQFRNNFSDFTADAEKEALEGLEQLMRQDPERDVDFMAFANLINSVSSPAIKNLNLIGIEQGLKMRIHGLEKQLEECESRLKEYQRKNIILQGDLREARNHHNNESSLPSDAQFARPPFMSMIQQANSILPKSLADNIKNYVSGLLSLVETLVAERQFLYRHVVDMMDSGMDMNSFLRSRHQIEGTLGSIFVTLKEADWTTRNTLLPLSDELQPPFKFRLVVWALLLWILGFMTLYFLRDYVGQSDIIWLKYFPVSY